MADTTTEDTEEAGTGRTARRAKFIQGMRTNSGNFRSWMQARSKLGPPAAADQSTPLADRVARARAALAGSGAAATPTAPTGPYPVGSAIAIPGGFTTQLLSDGTYAPPAFSQTDIVDGTSTAVLNALRKMPGVDQGATFSQMQPVAAPPVATPTTTPITTPPVASLPTPPQVAPPVSVPTPVPAPTLAQFTPGITSKVEPFGTGTRTMYYVDGAGPGAAFTDLNSAKTFASQQIGRIALEKALYPGGGGLGPIGTNSPTQINDAYAQFRTNAKAAYEANPNAQTLATYQTSLNSAYDPQATTVTDPATATQLYGAGNYHQNADGTYEAGAVGANGVTDAQALAASDAYTQQILAAVHGGGVSPWVTNPQPTPTAPPATPAPAITPAGLTPTAAAAAAAQKARSQGQFPATTAATPAAGPSMETPGFSGSAGPSMEGGRPAYATPAVSQNPPTQPPPSDPTVGPGGPKLPSTTTPQTPLAGPAGPSLPSTTTTQTPVATGDASSALAKAISDANNSTKISPSTVSSSTQPATSPTTNNNTTTYDQASLADALRKQATNGAITPSTTPTAAPTAGDLAKTLMGQTGPKVAWPGSSVANPNPDPVGTKGRLQANGGTSIVTKGL